MKYSILDYIHFWWLAGLVNGLETPSATHLQSRKWNAHFRIMFNFWWLAGLVNGLKPHPPPLSRQKNEMLVFGLCSLLMISWAGWWTQTPSTIPLQPKNEILIFGLRSTSDDRPGWWMDSNSIRHLSPAKKMKCSFLDYVQLLMISQAGSWTQTPFATHLQPKKWNAHFWIMLNVWWLAGLVDGLKPHPPSLSRWKKIKCSFLDYVELLMIGRAGQWTQTPSATHLQPKKLNAHFLIMFNFWWSARLVDGLKPHPPPLSSQK